MPNSVDPTSLAGDELHRWYRRSPQDIERERQAADDAKYQAYFGVSGLTQTDDPAGLCAETDDEGGAGTLWIADGSGGYRAVHRGVPDYEAALMPPPSTPEDLPQNPAAPEEASVVDIGNPYNRALRKAWEGVNGPWPKTPDGRNYHVSHKSAIADGGTNTLDNVEPMHPDEHAAMHVTNGDYARWARRQAIARAFGGRVEPPNTGPGIRPPIARSPRVRPSIPGSRAPGLGWLQLIPDITGIASGRIRTDNWHHMAFDLGGVPDPADEDWLFDPTVIDPTCRALYGNDAKPGDRCA